MGDSENNPVKYRSGSIVALTDFYRTAGNEYSCSATGYLDHCIGRIYGFTTPGLLCHDTAVCRRCAIYLYAPFAIILASAADIQQLLLLV